LPEIVEALIIKGGKNIVSHQIDEAVCSHAAILDAASIGIPDENHGEDIMVCCKLKPGRTCAEEDLREHCRKILGEFKTPKILRFVDELPKDSSGKIQRQKLRKIGEGDHL